MRFLSLTHVAAGLFSLVAPNEASINVPYEIRTKYSFQTFEAPTRIEALSPRALPNAPNGYAPEVVDCLSGRPVVRSANGLSPNEVSWLKVRRTKTVSAMRDLLGKLAISNFDAATYIDNHSEDASALPVIGIAASGGSYRALMSCGGAIAAFDSRTAGSIAQGQFGGLLQSSTYFSGLSGGSWLVGSVYLNNFTTITSLMDYVKGSSVWEFEESILTGPRTVSNYYRQLLNAVNSKVDAGFQASITDYWGRSLSYQLINASQGGISYTWSSIALQPDFIAGNMPLPIAIANERAVGETIIPLNTTIFEFNPWEFGSFDPTTYGFVPLEYIGSNFSAGVLPVSEGCVRGYDNAGYVMGTSSSLFNAAILELNALNASSGAQQKLQRTLNDLLAKIGDANNDIAIYNPNPFFGYHNESNKNALSKTLTLVDGAEDTQNIPLQPLLQPSRHVDVIFALDASADRGQENWPDGTSMVATYRRNLHITGIANGTGFPTVPGQNTFVNLGLNKRPTFFGCNASNMTTPGPLVVYLPNSPYSYFSNVSTFQLSYKNTERNSIIQNGYNVATMGNGTLDMTWPTCVGCAILSRSLERTGTKIPAACQTCFTKYCWDGTVNNTTPEPYQPALALKPSTQSSEGYKISSTTSTAATFVILVLGLMHVL